MKLSIIIVNWNVRELVRKCLSSVFSHPPKGDFEVFLVDNASSDNSAAMVAQDFARVKLIANDKNLGFAAANNQALRQASGDYLLILNPDTEVREGSIERMVHFLDTHPEVGIVAPRLLNADGSGQESIRRFPSFWSELFILTKLYKLFPKAAVLKNYLLNNFDYSKTQEVEQPMGACFLVRKSVLDKVGLFDEAFFLWMEEVDLEKRIIDAGYKIYYLPDAQVVHVGGQSFKQQFTVAKQKIFNASRLHYFKKHGSWWQVALLTLLNPLIITATTLLTGFEQGKRTVDDGGASKYSWRFFFGVCALIIFFEQLSWWGYGLPVMREVGWIGIMVLTLVLSLKRLEWGVMVQVTELIIGSKGHLFDLGPVSIRMGIFAIVFSAWVICLLRDRWSKKVVGSLGGFFTSTLFKYYVILAVAVLLGVVLGVMNNPIGNVITDANAWMFFLMTPVWYDALRSERSRKLLASTVVIGLGAQLGKMFLVLYVMGHAIYWQDYAFAVYRWVRETGVGEVTQLKDSFYRVFFQSQIYLVTGLFAMLSVVAHYFLQSTKKGVSAFFNVLWQYKGAVVFLSAIIAGVLLSFSRSFWLAIGVTGLVWCAWLMAHYRNFRALWLTAMVVMISTVIGVGMITTVSLFPYPSSTSGFGLGVFGSRLSDLQNEAAAASRWNLLPVLGSSIQNSPLWGHGFGREVTYYSKDPRVLEVNPTGAYTTFSFEWGYLDFIVKMGVLGLIAYAALIFAILRQGWRWMKREDWRGEKGLCWGNYGLLNGFFWGFVALLLVHVFTPYLNHPLGIGLVMLMGVLFEEKKV